MQSSVKCQTYFIYLLFLFYFSFHLFNDFLFHSSTVMHSALRGDIFAWRRKGEPADI